MATTTLTLPAAEATPAPAQSFGTAHGTILALDLGTTTGFALRTDVGAIVSGTVSFRPDRWQSGGMRFLRFKRWLTEIKNQAGGVDLVVYEQVRRHAGVDAAHAFGGWLAILTAWCDHHEIAYQGVPVGTIKRFIAGKGNADKDAVIAAIRSRGFNPADDNEADAIAILLWAIETQGGVR
jgi:Holliday junction resolvasome RuvABC endonuclease subunit